MTVDFETVLTIIYVLVDDWYQHFGRRLLKGKRGAKPIFGDSAVITLLWAMDFLPFPGETQFLGFIRANYRSLFPELVNQSQFNRRARDLRLLVEELRRHWALLLGVTFHTQFLLDTKPVPVVGYKRSQRRSDFAGSAAYGVCASRNMKYFGYKLVTLSTLEGFPVAYELVPANSDERAAAEEVLSVVWNSDIYGDKGFLDEIWQQEQHGRQGNRLWTPKRINQKMQNPEGFDRWLNSIRERIEGVFNEVQNTGRNLERLLRKTIIGLTTHVIAKMASHALRLVLHRFHGIDVLTFTTVSA